MGANNSANRATLRPHLADYVREFVEVLGTDDFSELVNHLIQEHKRFVGRNVGLLNKSPSNRANLSVVETHQPEGSEETPPELVGFFSNLMGQPVQPDLGQVA